MMTETALRFYLMPIQPFLIICTVCATLRTCGSDNVSLISATKDTRPGRTALPSPQESLKTVTVNESKATKSHE